MKWSHFERLMELRNSGRIEEAIRESDILVAASTDPNEKASVLTNEHVCFCILGRFVEAREVLQRIQALEITDLGVRLNAEFCEPCLLIDEGKPEEGLSAFAGILRRYSSLLKDSEFRYLYEDIQFRRAWTLFGLGRHTEALPILKEASSFTFEKAEDEQRMHFALGVSSEEAGEIQIAKERYVLVAGFDFKNDLEQRARYRLARLHVADHAFAQARKQLEIILADYPIEHFVVPRKYVYAQLSIVCSQLGDKANANRYNEMAKRQ